MNAGNGRDAGEIRLHAHTIKGISANVSAKRLFEAACLAEDAGKEGNTEIDPVLKKLEQEIEMLMKTLEEMFTDILAIHEKSYSDEIFETISEDQK